MKKQLARSVFEEPIFEFVSVKGVFKANDSDGSPDSPGAIIHHLCVVNPSMQVPHGGYAG